MWTISYEFRCYLLAALFGLVGLYVRPRLFALLTGVVLAANLLFVVPQLDGALELPGPMTAIVGQPMLMVRLLGAFMAGTCFWLLRPAIRGRLALGAAVLLPAVMFVTDAQPITVVLLGGYVLFWLVFRCPWPPLRRINATNDISYGVYLYAFPLAQLLIFFWRGVDVVVLVVATFLLSLICGSLSWWTVEKPALALKGRRPVRRGGRGVGGRRRAPVPSGGREAPDMSTAGRTARATVTDGAPAGS
jgi:peptidoglycan/LPS O-acetylase OafA/YrhL